MGKNWEQKLAFLPHLGHREAAEPDTGLRFGAGRRPRPCAAALRMLLGAWAGLRAGAGPGPRREETQLRTEQGPHGCGLTLQQGKNGSECMPKAVMKHKAGLGHGGRRGCWHTHSTAGRTSARVWWASAMGWQDFRFFYPQAPSSHAACSLWSLRLHSAPRPRRTE